MRRAYAFPATLTPEETAQLTMLYRAGAREARHATARCVIAGGPGELDPNLLEGLAARSLVRTLTARRPGGWETELWWLTPAGCKAAEQALRFRRAA